MHSPETGPGICHGYYCAIESYATVCLTCYGCSFQSYM
jgi:hypothetical protein